MADLSSSSIVCTKASPEHLNSTGCSIRHTNGKGRGVFASRLIPAHTLVEISPVLLFTSREYEEHGRHTVLDHYTFKWRDGRMALALGLGSLFNHSETPNVSYTMDTETESIRYITTRQIHPDEELCIFYGQSLWFDPVDHRPSSSSLPEEPDDDWGGLTQMVEDYQNLADDSSSRALDDGDLSRIVPEEDLPFIRVKIMPDEEEEDLESIRTVDVWVVDIKEPRRTMVMLKWLKNSGYDTPTLSHLKRIRKSETHSTLLLTNSSIAPILPADLGVLLSEPYLITVPRTPALTPSSLKLKNSLWPTVFAPRRKGEPEAWSRARLRWAKQAMHRVIDEARLAREAGELPIASYVPTPLKLEGDGIPYPSFVAHDIRISASHPLRHSVLHVIRMVADYRTSVRLEPPLLPSSSAPSIPSSAATPTPEPEPGLPRNGQHYLLTSLTLFTTHEPCIMCSMALLHSRVKEVFYLVPMEKTGGCGGMACIPRLDGVNHRFAIGKWKMDCMSVEDMRIDDDLDA